MENKKFNKIIGNAGEDIACKYLQDNGYKILERNYTCKLGEIDIIALKKDVIVFVEVKARKSDFFGLPREAVTNSKQYKIRLVAQMYLKYKHLMNKTCRFDVIEILQGNITHLENCF